MFLYEDSVLAVCCVLRDVCLDRLLPSPSCASFPPPFLPVQTTGLASMAAPAAAAAAPVPVVTLPPPPPPPLSPPPPVCPLPVPVAWQMLCLNLRGWPRRTDGDFFTPVSSAPLVGRTRSRGHLQGPRLSLLSLLKTTALFIHSVARF